MCFYQVKFEGKSKWDPPSTKIQAELWDLGAEPKGKLEFTFTCEPLEYKKELAKLAKEALAQPAENPPGSAPVKPVPAKKNVMTE